MEELITSARNPLCAHIRKLGAERSYRREQGQFLCEGIKLTEEAVRWQAGVEILVTAQGTPFEKAFPEVIGARRMTVPERLLRTLSTVETPQGVLAVCRTPSLELPQTLPQGRFLVLDGLQDPGNVGTIWRTADAFGADGLILLHGCADPFSPKTVRATMGACFRLPAWETELEPLFSRLKEAGVPLYATALRPGALDVRQVSLSSAAVLIGSEGRGVSESALEGCEKTMIIPMLPRCESLNAAVAASIVLWEMYAHDGEPNPAQ